MLRICATPDVAFQSVLTWAAGMTGLLRICAYQVVAFQSGLTETAMSCATMEFHLSAEMTSPFPTFVL